MTFLSYPKLRNLSIIDLIVLSSYYIFSLLLFLSLAGLFRKEFVIAGLITSFLIFLLFFRRVDFPKRYWFFVVIPIIFIGIILIKGYFAGMGMNFYLPWAREIVLTGNMPEVVGINSRMPLMPLFYAGIFSLLGFSHWVIAIPSFFFASAAALIIYIWLSEKGSAYSIFGVLLLLTSPLFLEVAMHPLQEPFVLFFAAAFFYYLEKSQKTTDAFNFLLMFLSAALAALSKEVGIVLFLPLGWFFIKNIKNKQYAKPLFYLLLTLAPLLAWLVRNYVVFGNPLSPSLNGLFKGAYYEAILISNRLSALAHDSGSGNILADLIQIPASYVASFLSLSALSFYGFLKERKFQYILLFFILLLVVFIVESQVGFGFIRYTMFLLPVFIVYAIAGMEKLQSKAFLSVLFSVNLWGLFSFNNYGLVLSLALGLYFYFFISRQTQFAKYLVLFSACFYLVRAEVFHVGRWFNIWLPIFSLLFVVLTWKIWIKLKEDILLKGAAASIVALLVLNGWGMALAYFLTHEGFVFPNLKEAYEPRPAMASEIEKIESRNRDFYILTTGQAYFEWYANFRTMQIISPTFHALTRAEYGDDLTSAEINELLRKNKIKYVMHKENMWPELEFFFDKMKNHPDLFKPIYQQGKFYLWQVI